MKFTRYLQSNDTQKSLSNFWKGFFLYFICIKSPFGGLGAAKATFWA